MSQNFTIKYSHNDAICCKTHQEYKNDRAVRKLQSQSHYKAQKIEKLFAATLQDERKVKTEALYNEDIKIYVAVFRLPPVTHK